jgi:hypothetical protein
MPMGPAEWPIVVRNLQGSGSSAYVAFEAGALYAASGLKHIEAFMTRVIDGLIEKKQVEVRAPYSVEVTVRTQDSPKRYIIHLANRTHSPNDMTKVTELVPVDDIEVHLASPFQRASGGPGRNCANAESRWHTGDPVGTPGCARGDRDYAGLNGSLLAALSLLVLALVIRVRPHHAGVNTSWTVTVSTIALI